MTKGHEVTGSAAAPSGIPKMAERPGRPETLPTVPSGGPAAAGRPPANGKKGKAPRRNAPASSNGAATNGSGPEPQAAKPARIAPRPATSAARKAKAHPGGRTSTDGKAATAKKPGHTVVKVEPRAGAAEPAKARQHLNDLEIIERIVPETKPRGLLGISFGTIKLDRMEDKLFASSEDTLARERAAARKPVLSFLKRPAHAAKTPDAARSTPIPELAGDSAKPPPDPRPPEPAWPAAETDHAGAADSPNGAFAFLGRLMRRVNTAPGQESGSGDTAAAPSESGAVGAERAPSPNWMRIRGGLRGLTDRARSLIRSDVETKEPIGSDHAKPAAKPALPAAPAMESPEPARPDRAAGTKPAGVETSMLPTPEAYDGHGALDGTPLPPPAAEEVGAPVDSPSSPDTPHAAKQAGWTERAKGPAAAEPASPGTSEAGSAERTLVSAAKPKRKLGIEAKPVPAFAQFRSLDTGPDDTLAFAENLSPDPPCWPDMIALEPEWHTRAKDVLSQAAELARELEADAGSDAVPGPAVTGRAPDMNESADAVSMQDADAPAHPADEPPPMPGATPPRQLRLDEIQESWEVRDPAEPFVDEPVLVDEDLSGADDHDEVEAEDRPPAAALPPPPFPDATAAELASPVRRPVRGFRPIERPSILFPDPDPLQEAGGEEQARDSSQRSAVAESGEAPALRPFTADSGPIFHESFAVPESESPAGDKRQTDKPPDERPASHRRLPDRESEATPHQSDTRVYGWLRGRATHPAPSETEPASDTHGDHGARATPSGSSARTAVAEDEASELDLWRGKRPPPGEEVDEADHRETGEAGAVQPPAERRAEAYDEYGEAAAAADEWRIGDEKDDLDSEPVRGSSGQDSLPHDQGDGDYEEESTPAADVVSMLNVLPQPSGRPERAANMMRDIARTATEYYAVPEKWPSAVKLGTLGMILGGALGLLVHKLIGMSGLPLLVLIIICTQIVGGLGFYLGYTKPFTSGSNKTRNRPAKSRRRAGSHTWERMDRAPRVSDSGYPDDPESFIRAFEEGRLPPPRTRRSAARTTSKKQMNRQAPPRHRSGRRKRR